jgi:hypothetical protein
MIGWVATLARHFVPKGAPTGLPPPFISAVLALATLVLRAPFLTPRLAHWDAVNYALGMHEFDVAAHQPHPPGSPFYVLLGRAALTLTGDDNAALILISLLASVGAVVAEYMLGRRLFGVRGGVLAAVLLMTQPVFWGYGTMGTPWTLLACLALAIGLLCVELLSGRRELVLPSAAFLGLASGFRLDVAVFLAPLWVYAVWKAEPRWRLRLLTLGIVVAGVLAWLVPVALGSGGASVFADRTLAMFVPPDLSSAPLLRQLASNTAISFGTLALAIGPAIALSLLSDRHRVTALLKGDLVRLSALWIGPIFVFLWLVDSTEPGHAMLYVVLLCALGAGLLVSTNRHLPRLVTCGAFVVALQSLGFLFAGPQADRPPAWWGNSMLLNVTAPGLRQQQVSLDQSLQIVQRALSPEDTLVLTVTGQDPYRYMMYYLPAYLVLRLDPHAHSALPARERRQGNWTEVSGCLADPRVQHIVFVLYTRSEPGLYPDGATLLSGETGPYQVWTVEPSPATPAYAGFALGGNCAP